MNRAFGAKPETVSRQCQMSRIASVKILTHRFGNPIADAIAQRIANVKIFSRDAKCHGSLRNVNDAFGTYRVRSTGFHLTPKSSSNALTRPRYRRARSQRGTTAHALLALLRLA